MHCLSLVIAGGYSLKPLAAPEPDQTQPPKFRKQITDFCVRVPDLNCRSSVFQTTGSDMSFLLLFSGTMITTVVLGPDLAEPEPAPSS